MASLRRNIATIGLIAGAAAACGTDTLSWPSAPSAQAPVPFPPPVVSPSAVPINLGEPVTKVVTTSDSAIQTTWGAEPCVRFSLAVPRDGNLRVRLTSPDPSRLTLWVNQRPFWPTGVEITGVTPVQGGWTYEIVVSLHDVREPSQTFELTALLDSL